MQVDATIFNEAQDTKNQEAWVLCFFFARKTRLIMVAVHHHDKMCT